jgi:ergothioneine biosynthesis protein EgtB
MQRLLQSCDESTWSAIADLLKLGIAHEEQHQELILTDIKYNLAVNPLRPAYHDASIPRGTRTENTRWESFNGGVVPLGADSDGFAFDNERPRHRVFLEPYRLATRPVTNGEFLEFLESGGYGRSDLWLSEGWASVQEHHWTAPLYWEQIDGTWWMQTLSGMTPVDIHAPLAHVSYYEADAFARFAGCRLPTEAEWEHAAERVPLEGNFQDSGLFHPVPEEHGRARQMFGDVWEWTRSAYLPYPGFQPFSGDVGEYNGKFMVNQMVLRGGSCVTAASHMRTTYRNFFHPGARWQFA